MLLQKFVAPGSFVNFVFLLLGGHPASSGHDDDESISLTDYVVLGVDVAQFQEYALVPELNFNFCCLF